MHMLHGVEYDCYKTTNPNSDENLLWTSAGTLPLIAEIKCLSQEFPVSLHPKSGVLNVPDVFELAIWHLRMFFTLFLTEQLWAIILDPKWLSGLQMDTIAWFCATLSKKTTQLDHSQYFWKCSFTTHFFCFTKSWTLSVECLIFCAIISLLGCQSETRKIICFSSSAHWESFVWLFLRECWGLWKKTAFNVCSIFFSFCLYFW